MPSLAIAQKPKRRIRLTSRFGRMPTSKSPSSKKRRRKLQGCNKEIESKRRSVSGDRRNAYGSFPENKCGPPVSPRVSLQGERGGGPQRRNRSQNQQRPPAGSITRPMIADILPLHIRCAANLLLERGA